MFRVFLCVAIAATTLAGCGAKVDGSAPAAAASAAAASGRASGAVAISVTSYRARQRNFDVTLEAIGTVTALSSVEVKPQVGGVITQVQVQEGQFVRAGDALFTLDSRVDQSNVVKLRAQLDKDQAMLADAKRQLARGRDLLDKNFVSQGALDTNQTQVEAQLAAVAADRAAIDAALVALSYASIKAPGAGRVGSVNVYPGTSVQANQTLLVTITQLDPINVSFNVPQDSLGVVLAGLKAGGATVYARLPDDAVQRTGKLQFVDNAVDAATGTVKVRARFSNHDARLWPGAFVQVSFVSATLKDAVVIPAAAVIQSPRGAIVYIAEQGKALMRPVQVIASEGEEVAVTGVQPGDKVVVEGRQNLRPDAALIERTPQAKASARAASAQAS
jgi:RND family efflux transporter MFP subunit